MDETTIKIHNLETGEIIERQMNAEELAQREEENLKNANRLALQTKANEAKIAAKAKLAALGLTADDLKALGL
jgi:hypothetical protein